jgi:hypothetical protein
MKSSSLTKIVNALRPPRSRADDPPFWPRHPEIWAVAGKLIAPSVIQMLRPSCRPPRPMSRCARGRICSARSRGSMRARCGWLRCRGSTADRCVYSCRYSRRRRRCHCGRSARHGPDCAVAPAAYDPDLRFRLRSPSPRIHRCQYAPGVAGRTQKVRHPNKPPQEFLEKSESSKPKNGPRSPARARRRIAVAEQKSRKEKTDEYKFAR